MPVKIITHLLLTTDSAKQHVGREISKGKSQQEIVEAALSIAPSITGTRPCNIQPADFTAIEIYYDHNAVAINGASESQVHDALNKCGL